MLESMLGMEERMEGTPKCMHVEEKREDEVGAEEYG